MSQWYEVIYPRCDGALLNENNRLINIEQARLYSDTEVYNQWTFNEQHISTEQLSEYGEKNKVYKIVSDSLVIDPNFIPDMRNNTISGRISGMMTPAFIMGNNYKIFNSIYYITLENWNDFSSTPITEDFYAPYPWIQYIVKKDEDIYKLIYYNYQLESWIEISVPSLELDKPDKPYYINSLFDSNNYTSKGKFTVNNEVSFEYVYDDVDSFEGALNAAIAYSKEKSYALPKISQNGFEYKLIKFFSEGNDDDYSELDADYADIILSTWSLGCSHYNNIQNFKEIYQKATKMEYHNANEVLSKEQYLKLIKQMNAVFNLNLPLIYPQENDTITFKYDKHSSTWKVVNT